MNELQKIAITKEDSFIWVGLMDESVLARFLQLADKLSDESVEINLGKKPPLTKESAQSSGESK